MENGGIEKNLILLVNFFSNKNKNISLITFNKNNKKFFNDQIKIMNPNTFFLRFKNRKIRNLVCLFILVKLILRNRNCLIFSFQSNLYVTLLSKLFNVKNIIRIASYGWMRSRLKKIIFFILLKLPTEIIVNSNEMRKILKKEFNIKAKCIYNPLDIKNIDKTKNSSKKYFDKNKKILKILFLARLVDAKDPITFLKGVKKINSAIKFQALMVGNGSMKKIIISKIGKYNLKNKVKLIDYTPYPMKFINQCDLIIMTSKFEGLPNVLIEAQYLKKYIISTNCKTGPKEILKNGRFGSLINIGDYNSLKNKIELFYNNKNKKIIKKKIEQGYNNLKRFDYLKNCKEYEKILEKCQIND